MPNLVLSQVRNVVLLMLENRSLDNVLGWLYQDQSPSHVFPASSPTRFDGLQPGAFNNPLLVNGSVVEFPVVPVPKDADDRDRIPWYDPYEEFRSGDRWNGVMNQLFGDEKMIEGLPSAPTRPRMLGFLQDYHASYMITEGGRDILWTYTPEDLRVINGLARTFAVSDAWFCSVPTQTNPNRAFSLCGTSLGRESNGSVLETYDAPTIFESLSKAGKTWGLYFTSRWTVTGKSYTEFTFPRISGVMSNGEIGGLDTFYQRAKGGTLPDFTYLEPTWGYGKGVFLVQGTDFHPPTRVDCGDSFLGEVYGAIRSGPQWEQTLLIVTFDEHGGT